MIGAFRRKFGKFASSVLKTVYVQCIRPRLDYGCSAWAPIQKKSIDDLERAQKFATRSILNDWTSDYESNLNKLQWPTLRNRRAHLNLCQFYKLYNGYSDYSNCQFAHVDNSSLRLSRLHPPAPHHLILPRHRTNAYKQSFLYSSMHLWNCLSSDTILKDVPRTYDGCDYESLHFINYGSFSNYVSSLQFNFDFIDK